MATNAEFWSRQYAHGPEPIPAVGEVGVRLIPGIDPEAPDPYNVCLAVDSRGRLWLKSDKPLRLALDDRNCIQILRATR